MKRKIHSQSKKQFILRIGDILEKDNINEDYLIMLSKPNNKWEVASIRKNSFNKNIFNENIKKLSKLEQEKLSESQEKVITITSEGIKNKIKFRNSISLFSFLLFLFFKMQQGFYRILIPGIYQGTIFDLMQQIYLILPNIGENSYLSSCLLSENELSLIFEERNFAEKNDQNRYPYISISSTIGERKKIRELIKNKDIEIKSKSKFKIEVNGKEINKINYLYFLACEIQFEKSFHLIEAKEEVEVRDYTSYIKDLFIKLF